MHSLQAYENIIIRPIESLSTKADGWTWEKVWREQMPYTDRLRRIQATKGKIDVLCKRGISFSEKKILDIGCGDGTTLGCLARQFGCRGYGVDISPSAITLAK